MPSQAEEHRISQPDADGGADSSALHTRVSELLDNATETPEDEFVREEQLRKETASDDGNVVASSVDAEARSAAKDAGDHIAQASTEPKPDEAGNATAELQESLPSDDPGRLADAATADGETAEPDGSAESDDTPEEDEVREDADREDAPIESVATEVDASSKGKKAAILGKHDDGLAASTVRIRGRPGGVLVEIDDEGEWAEILRLLGQRLDAAEGFFRGGKAVVEVGARDVYEDELRQARDMLARHDMTLAVVRSTSDLTLQSSLLLGLSTSSQAEEPVEQDRDMAPVVPITQPTSPYFVHNGTLRSGQILRKAESIMIVGDVNPGAKVISGGDVMVWGRLRGLAYAGASGNKGALVAAIEFSPTQLRIASVTAVPPDAPKSRGLRFWKKNEPEKRPEVAHIANGHIVVEPWDDSRPGRPRVGRK